MNLDRGKIGALIIGSILLFGLLAFLPQNAEGALSMTTSVAVWDTSPTADTCYTWLSASANGGSTGIASGTLFNAGLGTGWVASYDSGNQWAINWISGDTEIAYSEKSTGAEAVDYVGYVASTTSVVTASPNNMADMGYHRIPTPQFLASDYSSYIDINWDVQTDAGLHDWPADSWNATATVNQASGEGYTPGDWPDGPNRGGQVYGFEVFSSTDNSTWVSEGTSTGYSFTDNTYVADTYYTLRVIFEGGEEPDQTSTVHSTGSAIMPPPVPASIEFAVNWNCFAMIGDEDGNPDTATSLTASTVAASIEGVTNVYQISGWTSSGWQTYARRDGSSGAMIGASGVGDFTLENGESYMIRTVGAGTWNFPYTLFTEQPDWNITGGWNAVNCARTTETTSSDLIGYAFIDAAATWDGGWNIDLGPEADFTIQDYPSGTYVQDKNGNGIFVRSTDYSGTNNVDGSTHNFT
jgi:hypothetical protein